LSLRIKFLSRKLDILLCRHLGFVDIGTHRGLYAEIENELLGRVAQFFRWGGRIFDKMNESGSMITWISASPCASTS
jgi:hypothetical protein